MLNYHHLETLLHERHYFLLAEAEKEQLIRVATGGHTAFVHPLRSWLGALLVAWGKALQGEYSPAAFLPTVKTRPA